MYFKSAHISTLENDEDMHGLSSGAIVALMRRWSEETSCQTTTQTSGALTVTILATSCQTTTQTRRALAARTYREEKRARIEQTEADLIRTRIAHDMLLNEFGVSKTLSVCKSVMYPCNFLLAFFVFIIHNR
jgi:hypothetical protein